MNINLLLFVYSRSTGEFLRIYCDVSMHSRLNWNLEVLVFKERGKPEYSEKNFSEQGREPTRNVSHCSVTNRSTSFACLLLSELSFQ